MLCAGSSRGELGRVRDDPVLSVVPYRVMIIPNIYRTIDHAPVVFKQGQQ